jgi:hypothetical protein
MEKRHRSMPLFIMTTLRGRMPVAIVVGYMFFALVSSQSLISRSNGGW